MSSSSDNYPSPVITGLACKCPRCGKGPLYAGFLTLDKTCSNCELEYDFADAGDGATWFVMLVASVIAISVSLWVEFTWQPAYWVHAIVAIPLAVGVPLLLLRPAKALLINQQFVTKAAPGQIE